VLAFAEGRVNGSADQGDIDLVLRRSFDNGATWEDMRLVYEDGTHTIGNPSPVVDRDTGDIILLFNRDNVSVLVARSADDGATWSAPVDITKDVKLPQWKWYAMGPGHAIQLKSGRLFVTCDHSENNVQYSHVIYSDDHGASWKPGGTLPHETDEATSVELADGSVMINMRNLYMKGKRAVSVSKDGGLTWSKISFAKDLVEPVCEGSILRYPPATDGEGGRLLFSNPASRVREKMTVKMSSDEGKTWPVARLINSGASGYSDLAVLADKSVGLLFENGKKDYFEKITFARFTVDWLAGEKIIK
jgi:sialidase-1